MIQIGAAATRKLRAVLLGQSGGTALSAVLGQISQQHSIPQMGFNGAHIIPQNVAPEIVDRSAGAQYPSVHIYCAKLVNSLKEKFRTFSGEAQMAAEVRVSQDRLQGLESSTQLLADAVAEVLDGSRGDWADGIFYAGGYEITYAPVKQGGRNFVQTAKISFTLQVSS